MASLVPFLFLDVPDAARFVDRWSPQVVAGQVLSVSGVNAYTRARIHLRRPECVGMLVNIRNIGYVLHRHDDTYELACCLWPAGAPSIQEFRDLREWCRCVLAEDVEFDGTRLVDDLERELWTMSMFDA